MTREDIYQALERNISAHRKRIYVLMASGGIFALVGVLVYMFNRYGDLPMLLFFCGVGVFINIVCLLVLGNKRFENKTRQIKMILDTNPAFLVWAHVRISGAGKGVMMYFRDGMYCYVDAAVLPGKDTSAFLAALQKLNPLIHLGYSEELQFKFRRKSL